ncbi:MAG: alpha-L-fucosidase, partial [bacterium]|nr:alpha-L-fucosidase [bacterium]
PWDRHEPAYHDNSAYDDFYVNQLRELATRYGELVEFWLDGAGSEGHVYDFGRYVETLRTYQPNTLIFAGVGFLPWGDIRWAGNERGVALEDNWNVVDRHGYLRWRPVEADTPLREYNWFWHTNAEDRLRPLEELLEIYHGSVGRGAQLVLGLAPDSRGLIPEVDVARLEEFGSAIRRIYGRNLARRRGTPAKIFDGDPDTYWAEPEIRDQNKRATQIVAVFDGPKTFDRTVAMEWVNTGQHIQKYRIEAQVSGQWKVLHTGTSIGHKKIDLLPRTSSNAVRLNILWASGPA